MLAIISCLSVITYQDFKERQISWITIPSLVFLFGGYALTHFDSWKDYLFIVAINFLFITIQLSVLFIYFSIRAGKFINLINTKIGIGDVLFFLALTFAFTTVNFIVFYVVSLSMITISFLLIRVFFKNVQNEIPLAGAMAAILIGWYLVSFIFPFHSPLNDMWFFK
jgi:hypothetical protein